MNGRSPSHPFIESSDRIATRFAGRYNAGMFDQSLDLSDVLARLKRADESLAEFIAPLWPGVSLAAAWIEGKPRLFHLQDVPTQEDYYLLKIEEGSAAITRLAEAEEVRKYLNYLTKASVVLLDQDMAYPAGPIERLQGIIGPHPIRFAQGVPLMQVQARFDGLNLLFDSAMAERGHSDNPLEELFAGGASLSFGSDLLDIPAEEASGEDASQVLDRLRKHPDLYTEYRLKSVLEAGGAVLESWSREADGLHIRWRLEDDVHTVILASDNAPITSGISLAAARTFDPAQLIRLLHEHILDAWK